MIGDSELFRAACRAKGWLKKKSPVLVKGYQNRYCEIRNEGTLMVYFKAIPEKFNDTPKGVIKLEEVDSLVTEGKKKIVMKYGQRDFEFKAESKEKRDQWFKVLNVLLKKIQHEGPGGSVSLNASRSSSLASNYDPQRSDTVVKRNKIALADYTEELANENALRTKGVHEYIRYLNKDMLTPRMCYGFLGKLRKGHVQYYQKRWLLLISRKPLTQVVTEEMTDQDNLDETTMPPWLSLETVYYFKLITDDDDSTAAGSIPLKDLAKAEAVENEQGGWLLRIDIGTRIFEFQSEFKEEVDRWVTACRRSSKTARESEAAITDKNKNIDKIIRLFDSEGPSSLLVMMNQEWNLQIRKDPEDCDHLGEVLEPALEIRDNLVGILDACLAHEPKREDIYKWYMKNYHEKICKMLITLWERHWETVSPLEIVQLLIWVKEYNEELKIFGVNDERITNGLKDLCNAYTRKVYYSLIPLIIGVLKSERELPPETNADGLLTNSAPTDLFTILQEPLVSVQDADFTDLYLKFLMLCQESISQYQLAVSGILKSGATVELEWLCAICNNTITFNTTLIEFIENIKRKGDLSDEQIEERIQTRGIAQKFLKITDICKDTLMTGLVAEFQGLFNVNYVDLDLEASLERILEVINEPAQQLHTTFERKLYRESLDKCVSLYVKCILSSNLKGPAGDIEMENIIATINEDINDFKGAFSSVSTRNFDEIIKICYDLIEFFEATPAFFAMHISLFKREYPELINLNFIKMIISMRPDFSKEDRKEALDVAKDTLKSLNKKKHNDVKANSRNRAMSGAGLNLSERLAFIDGDRQRSQGSVPNSSMQFGKGDDDEPKTATIRLEDFLASVPKKKTPAEEFKEKLAADAGGSEDQSLTQTPFQKEKFDLEGYLEKKSPKTKTYQRRYFAIKNHTLYWYKSHTSTLAQNHIALNRITKVYEGKGAKFFIDVGDKVFKLQADEVSERDKWVSAITKLMKETATDSVKTDDIDPSKRYINSNLFDVTTGESLFRDFFAERQIQNESILSYAGEKIDELKKVTKELNQRESMGNGSSSRKGSESPTKMTPKTTNASRMSDSDMRHEDVETTTTTRGNRRESFEVEDPKRRDDEEEDHEGGGLFSCFPCFGPKRKNDKKERLLVN